MDTITIFILIISLMALLVTYAVFKSDQQPQIIVFALPHYGKQSFIQLQIKNIGKSIAYNVQISSDQPIPKRAFGIKKLNASKDYFDSVIFNTWSQSISTQSELYIRLGTIRRPQRGFR